MIPELANPTIITPSMEVSDADRRTWAEAQSMQLLQMAATILNHGFGAEVGQRVFEEQVQLHCLRFDETSRQELD